MSYCILYRKLCLRLPDGSLLAFVEAGDNNVWGINPLTGREERSRSFSAWDFVLGGGRKLSYTKEEIAAWLDNELKRSIDYAKSSYDSSPEDYNSTPEKDVASRYGFWSAISIYGKSTHSTSWNQFRHFFEDGIKKAIPIEDYFRTCGGLQLAWYTDARFERSKTFVSVEELIDGWDKTITEIGSRPWIVPASSYDMGFLSDILSGANKKGAFIKVALRNEEHIDEGFVKSLFPFEMTTDIVEALSFSKKAFKSVSIFRAFEKISGKKTFERFSFIRSR